MNAEKSNKSGPGPGKILGGFLVILALLGTVAWWLCDLSIKNQTQAILNREQEVQRAWLDKTLDNIRAWRKDGGMDTQTAIRVMSADARFDTDIVKALGLVPAAELEKIIGRKA